MVLRLKLIGTGNPKDAYRVNLPTYGLIYGNIEEGVALVAIPPETLGLTDDDLKDETSVETTEGLYYPSLSEATLDKVQTHLSKQYPGKKHQVELAEV